MKKFSTILFDVDGTLFNFDKTARNALSKTLIELGIEPTEHKISLYEQINTQLWRWLEEEKIDKDRLKTQRFRMFFEKIKVNSDESAASEIYLNNLSESIFLIDGAKEEVKRLSENHRLAIVTNGLAQVQHPRIDQSGIKDYFKHIFISEEVGHAKPKKQFFDHVFVQMDIVNLEKVIIVGDSLTSDIKGGNNAGIATCWYNPEGLENSTDSICDYIIKSLYEIEEII